MDFSSYDLNSLHLVHYSFERQCESVSLELEESELESPEFIENSKRLLHFSYLQELVSKEIEARRRTSLLFSYEDVFRIAGQFDKYIIIKFYRTSAAFEKYGGEVHGRLFYGRKARKELTETIANEQYLRKDGLLFLDGHGNDLEKIRQLKNDGFLASEIYSISTFNDEPNENAYISSDIKEIPNTISIPFESGEVDLARMQNLATSWKLQDGSTVLDHELTRYYTNEFILKDGNIPKEIMVEYLYKPGESVFKDDVIIQIYSYYLHYDALDEQAKRHYAILLAARAKRRFNLLKEDLGINDKSLERFKNEYPDAYRIVRWSLQAFQDETLTHHTEFPIYWDEERFVHIYGRHVIDYFEPYSTYKGTKFQYNYKDIRRVLCLILDKLKQDIDAALSKGNPYNKFGDKGYYFNGDYYTLKINKDGRIMTFYPMGK